MGCASSKHDKPAPAAKPAGVTIAKPADVTEAGRRSATASTASNVQEEEELAAHQERNYGLGKPTSETDRMRTLNTLAVLDTEPERRFDDITKLCALIFNVRACIGGEGEALSVTVRVVLPLHERLVHGSSMTAWEGRLWLWPGRVELTLHGANMTT